MAQLNIKERQAGEVSILDLSGKITIGEGSVQLREAVRRLLDEGKTNILLNLGDVSYVDSSGIGELVSSYTTTTSSGSKAKAGGRAGDNVSAEGAATSNPPGQLKLLNLTKKIQDLLMITKLLTVFETYDSEEAAIASFKK